MSFSNIQDYMSFFFIGKYVNGENISVRNIAPSLEDRKDILSKTAKLVNLAINFNLTPKNSLNYTNPENPELEASTNAFLNEFQVNVGFAAAKRRSTTGRNNNPLALSTYCKFRSEGLITAKPLGNLANDFVQITDVNARRFYGSLIAGAYIGNTNTVRAAYEHYYGNHMTHFFTALGTENQFASYKMMMFNKEDDVHKYLRDFYGFVYNYRLPPRAEENNNALVSFERIHQVTLRDTDDFNNKEFTLILSQEKTNRWNTTNTVMILDHMDVTSYYSVANGLILAKFNQIFQQNNYVVPQDNIQDIERFTYSTRSATGGQRNEKFRNISRAYVQDQLAPTPFVYIVKIVMPRNQCAYVLMTNLPEPFQAVYECPIALEFGFRQAAFDSSQNFKLAAESVKNYLGQYFKTVNNEQ